MTEAVEPIPKNIYGVTKRAAEDLCLLYSRKFGVNCTVLRTSRFFPEDDDNKETRDQFDSLNAKVNELLYRRVELDDVVSAHCLAMDYVTTTPFDRFIISATSPFRKEDCPQLRNNAQQAIDRYVPQAKEIYERRGWSMFAGLDRVYMNQHAREALGWEPSTASSGRFSALTEARIREVRWLKRWDRRVTTTRCLRTARFPSRRS